MLLAEICQPSADDLDWSEFLSLSFSRHMKIIIKTSSIEERKSYIHEYEGAGADSLKLEL